MRLANVAKKDIDVKFEHKKGVLSGFEDKSNVFLENVEAKSLSITSDKNTEGYENLNLISKQGVSLNKFEANQLRELTIKGSGELKIADVELNDGANPQFNKVNDGGIKTPGTRGFTKLDASGYTGSLTLDITDIVKEASDPFDSGRKLNTDIIGSKLGDTFYLRGGLGSRTNIDGGAGEDKLVLVSGSIGTGKRADGTTDSKITNIENLEMRAQSGDLSADFDRFDASLKRVLIRTEQMDTLATFTLSNISEKFSKEGVIDIEHSAGNDDKPNNYNTKIVATLKDASGKDDSLTFRVLDANNKDNSFEFEIGAAGVENITVKDDDTESNEMKLTNAADHTGKVTLTGGTAGKYFAVNSEIVAKEVDASGQKSDLRLTVRDQAANPGQTIKLGTGNDVLTFKELDGLDGKDTITDAGGNDVVRAIFSKDNALNLKGIEGVHVAALDNINLDVTNTDITKMTLMSREAVKQTDHVESLGYGVYGMNNAAFGAADISKKTITVKKSNISELNFAGDLDDKDDNVAADDGDKDQNFNGVELLNNQSKELNVNVSSSLDRIKEGAKSYTIGQITAHGVEKFNVKIKDEKDKTTTTKIDNVFGKNITHLKVTGVDKDGKEVATKGSVNLGTVSDGGSFKTMQEVDATNVGGAFTATVTSLGDNSQVKLGNGDNVFSAKGSGGNNITITAGNGKNTITGSARNNKITAGNGNNTIHADRGDNNIKVGNGNDIVTAKDGNNVVEFGNGRDKYEGNLGTKLKNDKIVTSITKTDGGADIKFATDGEANPTTTHHLIASSSETVQAVWEGDIMKNYAVNGHRAMLENEASTDGDDHYLVGAKYIGNSTNLEDTFNNAAATTIKGGKGNDSFTITKAQTNMITVEGGEGKDRVSINTKEKMTVKISDGDSVKGSNDVIYGFKTDTAGGAKNDVLDLDHAANLAGIQKADTAVSGYGEIAKYSVNNKGLVTFKDSSGNTVTINKNNLNKALDLLAKEYNNTNRTLAFNYDEDGDDATTNDKSTFVFQDGAKDTVVELAGVQTGAANGLTNGADAGDITVS